MQDTQIIKPRLKIYRDDYVGMLYSPQIPAGHYFSTRFAATVNGKLTHMLGVRTKSSLGQEEHDIQVRETLRQLLADMATDITRGNVV